MRLCELAVALGVTEGIHGDPDLEIRAIRLLEDSQRGHLATLTRAFADLKPVREAIEKNRHRDIALLTDHVVDGYHCLVISPEGIHHAIDRTKELFAVRDQWLPAGVDCRAVLEEDVVLGRDVSIGPWVRVGRGAVMGDRTTVHSGVAIYPNVRIGSDCTIHSGAVLRGGTVLGDRVEIDANAVVGCEGFNRSYPPEDLALSPPLAGVRIQDDVYIGAGCTISRSGRTETVIGPGTKIDAQVYVGYCSRIGAGTRIAGKSIIATAVIGDRVTVGAEVGIWDDVTIGDNALLVSRSTVVRDVGDGEAVAGTPAMPYSKAKRALALVSRLPEMWEQLQGLRRKVEDHKHD